MKSKRKLFLLVGLILLLTSLPIGCAESYTQEDLDAAYIEGRNAGLIEGHRAGYNEGYAEGKDAGVAELSPELTSKQAELTSTKQTLTSTQEELSSTQQTLAKTQEELEDAEAELLLSNIKVTNLSIPSGYVEPGEKVTISATVTNSGGIQISYPAILRINGSEVETKSVVLNAGESHVVSFTVANWSFGKYTVELGGLAGAFTVVRVIENLSYIKAGARRDTNYTVSEADDIIKICIVYYTSGGSFIFFENIPVTVTIKLYGHRKLDDALWNRNGELVYQEQFTVADTSEIIRIPFEEIAVDQNKYASVAYIKVTVTTAKQGDFEYIGRRFGILTKNEGYPSASTSAEAKREAQELLANFRACQKYLREGLKLACEEFWSSLESIQYSTIGMR